jgi:hypothetical protein
MLSGIFGLLLRLEIRIYIFSYLLFVQLKTFRINLYGFNIKFRFFTSYK